MTSLTLVRRIAARPSIVFEALTTLEGIAHTEGWNGALDKLEKYFFSQETRNA